jgi:hypothetical protein
MQDISNAGKILVHENDGKVSDRVQLLYFIYCVFVLNGVHYGTGQHMIDLTPQNFSAAMKVSLHMCFHPNLALTQIFQMWFFCEIFYGLSSTFTKLAAGTLLLRLTTKRLHVWIIWVIMILASLFGISFVAVIIAQCQPTGFFWSATRDPLQGHCIDNTILVGFTYAHAAVSSLGDWTFGILPALIVSGLNMNLRTKVSVFLILCFANIGSIATLIRIKAIHQISTSQDFLFATVDLAIWSSVEVGIGIVAASIATYRPLFRSFFSSGSTVNRSFGTANDSHRFRDSAHYGHGTPPNLGLHEMRREHKTAISETSTSEIFGMADSARGD